MPNKQYRLNQDWIEILKNLYYPNFPGDDGKFLEWFILNSIKTARLNAPSQQQQNDEKISNPPIQSEKINSEWNAEEDIEGL